MNREPHYVTCPCQFCSAGIEFDASDFAKAETRTTACPHCGLETILFVPQQAPSPLKSSAKAQSKEVTAQKAVPPKLESKPAIKRNAGGVSRIRVWIFLCLFLCLTVLAFAISGFMSLPTAGENDCLQKILELQKQEDALQEKSKTTLNEVVMSGGSWDAYNKMNDQISDLSLQRIKLHAHKQVLQDQRNQGSNLAFLASIVFCLFWIPALIYLFLVPKPKSA